MSYGILKTHQWDVEHVADRLRDAEKQEIASVSRLTPEEHITEAVKSARPALTLFIDSVPAAIAGITQENEDIGLIWFFGTTLIDLRTFTFLRACPQFLRELSRGYRLIHNHVCTSTPHHYRWAQWMGFKFSPMPLSTPDGRRFLHTYKFLCPQQSPSPA